MCGKVWAARPPMPTATRKSTWAPARWPAPCGRRLSIAGSAPCASTTILGGGLDVRENVKFFGGQLARWIHENFPISVCALAIEVKKFFMNEWTGELDSQQHQAIGDALAHAAAAVADELEKVKREPTVA